MKANPGKCHFLCNSNTKVNLTFENQKKQKKQLVREFAWIQN